MDQRSPWDTALPPLPRPTPPLPGLPPLPQIQVPPRVPGPAIGLPPLGALGAKQGPMGPQPPAMPTLPTIGPPKGQEAGGPLTSLLTGAVRTGLGYDLTNTLFPGAMYQNAYDKAAITAEVNKQLQSAGLRPTPLSQQTPQQVAQRRIDIGQATRQDYIDTGQAVPTSLQTPAERAKAKIDLGVAQRQDYIDAGLSIPTSLQTPAERAQSRADTANQTAADEGVLNPAQRQAATQSRQAVTAADKTAAQKLRNTKIANAMTKNPADYYDGATPANITDWLSVVWPAATPDVISQIVSSAQGYGGNAAWTIVLNQTNQAMQNAAGATPNATSTPPATDTPADITSQIVGDQGKANVTDQSTSDQTTTPDQTTSDQTSTSSDVTAATAPTDSTQRQQAGQQVITNALGADQTPTASDTITSTQTISPTATTGDTLPTTQTTNPNILQSIGSFFGLGDQQSSPSNQTTPDQTTPPDTSNQPLAKSNTDIVSGLLSSLSTPAEAAGLDQGTPTPTLQPATPSVVQQLTTPPDQTPTDTTTTAPPPKGIGDIARDIFSGAGLGALYASTAQGLLVPGENAGPGSLVGAALGAGATALGDVLPSGNIVSKITGAGQDLVTPAFNFLQNNIGIPGLAAVDELEQLGMTPTERANLYDPAQWAAAHPNLGSADAEAARQRVLKAAGTPTGEAPPSLDINPISDYQKLKAYGQRQRAATDPTMAFAEDVANPVWTPLGAGYEAGVNVLGGATTARLARAAMTEDHLAQGILPAVSRVQSVLQKAPIIGAAFARAPKSTQIRESIEAGARRSDLQQLDAEAQYANEQGLGQPGSAQVAPDAVKQAQRQAEGLSSGPEESTNDLPEIRQTLEQSGAVRDIKTPQDVEQSLLDLREAMDRTANITRETMGQAAADAHEAPVGGRGPIWEQGYQGARYIEGQAAKAISAAGQILKERAQQAGVWSASAEARLNLIQQMFTTTADAWEKDLTATRDLLNDPNRTFSQAQFPFERDKVRRPIWDAHTTAMSDLQRQWITAERDAVGGTLPTTPTGESPAAAQIITDPMRHQLRDLGWDDATISVLTPEAAAQAIRDAGRQPMAPAETASEGATSTGEATGAATPETPTSRAAQGTSPSPGQSPPDQQQVQELVDAGVPMNEAVTRAQTGPTVVGPTMPEAVSVPPESPVSVFDESTQHNIETYNTFAEQNPKDQTSFADQIEELAARRLTRRQIADELVRRYPSIPHEQADQMVFSVRVMRGIPSIGPTTVFGGTMEDTGERAAFEKWLADRTEKQRLANLQSGIGGGNPPSTRSATSPSEPTPAVPELTPPTTEQGATSVEPPTAPTVSESPPAVQESPLAPVTEPKTPVETAQGVLKQTRKAGQTKRQTQLEDLIQRHLSFVGKRVKAYGGGQDDIIAGTVDEYGHPTYWVRRVDTGEIRTHGTRQEKYDIIGDTPPEIMQSPSALTVQRQAAQFGQGQTPQATGTPNEPAAPPEAVPTEPPPVTLPSPTAAPVSRASTQWNNTKALAEELGTDTSLYDHLLQQDLAKVTPKPGTTAYEKAVAQTFRDHSRSLRSMIADDAAQALHESQAQIDGLKETLDPLVADLTHLIDPKTGDVKITPKQYTELVGRPPSDDVLITNPNGTKTVNPDYVLDEIGTARGYPDAESFKQGIVRAAKAKQQISGLESRVRRLTKLGAQTVAQGGSDLLADFAQWKALPNRVITDLQDYFTQMAQGNMPAVPEPALPRDLKGATPRYGKQQLNFASDTDKALYIVAQAQPSKSDAAYLAFLKTVAPDRSIPELRTLGKKVRSEIATATANDPKSETVDIPPTNVIPSPARPAQTPPKSIPSSVLAELRSAGFDQATTDKILQEEGQQGLVNRILTVGATRQAKAMNRAMAAATRKLEDLSPTTRANIAIKAKNVDARLAEIDKRLVQVTSQRGETAARLRNATKNQTSITTVNRLTDQLSELDRDTQGLKDEQSQLQAAKAIKTEPIDPASLTEAKATVANVDHETAPVIGDDGAAKVAQAADQATAQLVKSANDQPETTAQLFEDYFGDTGAAHEAVKAVRESVPHDEGLSTAENHPADVMIAHLQRRMERWRQDHPTPVGTSRKDLPPMLASGKGVLDGLHRLWLEQVMGQPSMVFHVLQSQVALLGSHGILPRAFANAERDRIMQLSPSMPPQVMNELGATKTFGDHAAMGASQHRQILESVENWLGSLLSDKLRESYGRMLSDIAPPRGPTRPIGRSTVEAFLGKPVSTNVARRVLRDAISHPASSIAGLGAETGPRLLRTVEEASKLSAYDHFIQNYWPSALKNYGNDTLRSTWDTITKPEPGVGVNNIALVQKYLPRVRGPLSIANVFDTAAKGAKTDAEKSALVAWESRAKTSFWQMDDPTRTSFDRAQRVANRATLQKMSELFINRTDYTRIEGAIRKVAPFLTYDLAMPAQWTTAFARNPRLLATLASGNEQVTRADQQQGLPNRMMGSIYSPALGGGIYPFRGFGPAKYVKANQEGLAGGLAVSENPITVGPSGEVASALAERALGGAPTPGTIMPLDDFIHSIALKLGSTLDPEKGIRQLIFGAAGNPFFETEVRRQLANMGVNPDKATATQLDEARRRTGGALLANEISGYRFKPVTTGEISRLQTLAQSMQIPPDQATQDNVWAKWATLPNAAKQQIRKANPWLDAWWGVGEQFLPAAQRAQHQALRDYLDEIDSVKTWQTGQEQQLDTQFQKIAKDDPAAAATDWRKGHTALLAQAKGRRDALRTSPRYKNIPQYTPTNPLDKAVDAYLAIKSTDPKYVDTDGTVDYASWSDDRNAFLAKQTPETRQYIQQFEDNGASPTEKNYYTALNDFDQLQATVPQYAGLTVQQDALRRKERRGAQKLAKLAQEDNKYAPAVTAFEVKYPLSKNYNPMTHTPLILNPAWVKYVKAHPDLTRWGLVSVPKETASGVPIKAVKGGLGTVMNPAAQQAEQAAIQGLGLNGSQAANSP